MNKKCWKVTCTYVDTLDRQIDRQTDRQTDRHTHTHTDTYTHTHSHTHTHTHTNTRYYTYMLLRYAVKKACTDSLVVENALIWLKLSLMLAHFHSRSCGRSGGALSINGSMAFAIVFIYSS